MRDDRLWDSMSRGSLILIVFSRDLCRRWPEVVLKNLETGQPAWVMTADDAAHLGSRRRGVEPLRIVIMPQKITRVVVAPTPVMVEPMSVMVPMPVVV